MARLRQILTPFLSVYLLILMVFPCSDAHASHSTPPKAHFEQHTQEHDHNATDACTPFCACGSCVIAIVIYPPQEIAFFFLTDATLEEPVLYQSLESLYKGSIWQPPQLL